ncbi:MAG: AI-2E family transporter [Ignavibacteriaceae bacterium]
MDNLLKNKILRFALWTAGIIFLLFLFYALLDLLIVVTVSILLAFIFNPFVLILEKQGFNRLSSVLLLFLMAGFVFYLGLSLFIPRFLFQLNQLIETLHVYSLHDQLISIEREIYNFLPFFTPGELARRVEQLISSQIIHLFDQISEVLTSIVSIIAILVIVPFITFFLLKDNRIILQGIITLMPNKYFEMSYWILKKITVQLGRFVRAWIFDASFVGIMCGVGFYLIGIENALPLGVIAGIGHLVPYFGPVIGGIPAIIISIIQYGNMSHVPLIILLMACVYTVDNGFVQPYVFSKGVGMHPIVIILLIIAGSQLFGVIGMLLAIPVATVIKTAAKEMYFAFKNYNIARL